MYAILLREQDTPEKRAQLIEFLNAELPWQAERRVSQEQLNREKAEFAAQM